MTMDEHNRGVYGYIDEHGRPRIDAPADTHVVRSKAQIEGYKRKLERDGGRGNMFSFADMENIRYITSNVPDRFCGYLLYLQSYLNYDGVISNTNKTPMKRGDMMTALGVKRTTFSEFMKCMERHSIIYEEVRNGATVYTIDPAYHWRGTTKNQRVIKVFSTALRELYRDVGAADLGFVYKLLPFVHFETNFICGNPYESDPNNIAKLGMDDIARLTGLTSMSVYNKMRKLKLDEHYVFAQVSRGDTAYYMINPFIFYRRDGYPDKTLMSIFATSPVRNYKNKNKLENTN